MIKYLLFSLIALAALGGVLGYKAGNGSCHGQVITAQIPHLNLAPIPFT